MKHQLGGQALPEAILIRSATRWAIAVRKPDTSVHTEVHAIPDRWARARKTVLRGPIALVDAVGIGLRALRVTTRQTTGADITDEQMMFSFVPVAVGALGVFVVVPGMLSSGWSGTAGDVIEAASRALMLVVYLLALTRSPLGRRLFGYHGAEHMAIAAFERLGRMPDGAETGVESPVHPRCGSSFIALFVIAAGIVFSFVDRRPLWLGAAVRVALVPVLAVISYEVMRAGATARAGPLGPLLTWPGRALQRLTTRRPDADQVEVALAALRAATDAA